MKSYISRFGLIQAGEIESFDEGKSLAVDGETIEPTASFGTRFNPMRETIIPTPPAEEGEEQQPDQAGRISTSRSYITSCLKAAWILVSTPVRKYGSVA
ncbi:hypothetical protein [Agrobacterium vitis]|uniref:hypothetical protein n=1 Tax=Agrobacterium vitis TaxID=373 RepID=UPI0015716B84|nr:hypothetical protein [Agrobacterium vitis]NSZ52964.1 hypothetical protein [Agrobacterium vitis]NTA31723.1 hypothetical protein [Agrobacterium vitis]